MSRVHFRSPLSDVLIRGSTLIGLALAICPVSVCRAAAPDQHRPNILFIFADDHASNATSTYGDARRLIITPSLDRLAHEGMRFERCLVPNSICGPSRATVLTGKYSHANGFYNNTNSKFDGSQVTFPKALQEARYQTAIFGKWHLVTDPTGFDTWQILPGQGEYYNPTMLTASGKTRHQGYVTDIITDLSLEWLKKRDPSRPFLLMCQHKAPHRGWEPALRHLDHDNDRQYPEPPTLYDDYSGRGKAEHGQDMTIAGTLTDSDLKLVAPPDLNAQQKAAWDAYYEPRNKAFREAKLEGKELTRWKYNRYLHDYLGCVKAVDESVGRLLKYLDDENLAQNTVVVYASDQGFFLGEHGWFDKRWIFEESLRTPLLARWPGVIKPASHNDSMVSNLDFAPTFFSLAGLPIPSTMQGRSLLPLFQGHTPPDWRTSFYYHYYEYPGPHKVRRHYGVVTNRFKLVFFYEPDVNEWEMFDLKTDPHELHNLFGQANYATIQRRLGFELEKLRHDLRVPFADPPESMIKAEKTARVP